jgi:4,5-dihydroxyphthalate decarboxylase
MSLELGLACCDYDRTRAIFDGRVRIEGCALTATALEPEEAFHRAFKYQEFDVSELSLSSYAVRVVRALSPRKVSPEEMFAPAACDLSKI